MASLSRRTLLTGAIAGAGALAFTTPAFANPGLVISGRGTLPAVSSPGGTTKSAVLGAFQRSRPDDHQHPEIGRSGKVREIKGPWATPANDFTAKVELKGLTEGRDYTYTVEPLSAETAGPSPRRGLLGHPKDRCIQ